jgi:hypothetical protein
VVEPPDWLEPLEPVGQNSRTTAAVVEGGWELPPRLLMSGSAPPPAVMARASMVRNERTSSEDAFQLEVSAEDFAVEHP